MLIVTPDVVFGGWDSLFYSLDWLHQFGNRLDEDGEKYWLRFTNPVTGRPLLPFFLALQDGMEPEELDQMTCPHCELSILDEHFTGLFLGGSDEPRAVTPDHPYWKRTTAATWQKLAKRWRLDFHYGRCGTMEKLAQAQRIQADSLDSALPLWDRKRFAHFAAAWDHDDQLTLLEVPDVRTA